MTYFNFLSNIEYKFTDGLTKNVKNMFSRPIVDSTQTNRIEISENQSPDQLSISLYEDPSLYYINLLQNDIISDNYWPISGEEFTEKLQSDYAGYSFHILEQPESPPTTGDVIVLKYDLNGFTPDQNNYTAETISYGIVESWDPHMRKLWIKNYSMGTTGAQLETEFFKEDNRFYIFRRNDDGQYSNEGSRISATNVLGENNAFSSDPNYIGNSGDEFTMKRVGEYSDSVKTFYSDTTDTNLNPYTKNILLQGSGDLFSYTNFSGTTYNSGNTNGTCSLLEGYILSANGQTGTDGFAYTLSQEVISVTDRLVNENDEKRKIEVIPRSVVSSEIQNIEDNFNG